MVLACCLSNISEREAKLTSSCGPQGQRHLRPKARRGLTPPPRVSPPGGLGASNPHTPAEAIRRRALSGHPRLQAARERRAGSVLNRDAAFNDASRSTRFTSRGAWTKELRYSRRHRRRPGGRGIRSPSNLSRSVRNPEGPRTPSSCPHHQAPCSQIPLRPIASPSALTARFPRGPGRASRAASSHSVLTWGLFTRAGGQPPGAPSPRPEVDPKQ